MFSFSEFKNFRKTEVSQQLPNQRWVLSQRIVKLHVYINVDMEKTFRFWSARKTAILMQNGCKFESRIQITDYTFPTIQLNVFWWWPCQVLTWPFSWMTYKLKHALSKFHLFWFIVFNSPCIIVIATFFRLQIYYLPIVYHTDTRLTRWNVDTLLCSTIT